MAANSTRPPSRWRGAKLFFPVVPPLFVRLSMGRGCAWCTWCSSAPPQFCNFSKFVRSSFELQPRKRGAFYGQKSHQDTRRPGDQDTAPPRGWWCIYVFGLKLLIMLYLHFNRPTFHALAALPQTRRGGRVWAWLGVGVAGCGCGSILGGVALYWGVYIYRGV